MRSRPQEESSPWDSQPPQDLHPLEPQLFSHHPMHAWIQVAPGNQPSNSPEPSTGCWTDSSAHICLVPPALFPNTDPPERRATGVVAADAASQHVSALRPTHPLTTATWRGGFARPLGPCTPTSAPTMLAGNLRQWCPVPGRHKKPQCWQNSRATAQRTV